VVGPRGLERERAGEDVAGDKKGPSGGTGLESAGSGAG
jgi:hypothetical protein